MLFALVCAVLFVVCFTWAVYGFATFYGLCVLSYAVALLYLSHILWFLIGFSFVEQSIMYNYYYLYAATVCQVVV